MGQQRQERKGSGSCIGLKLTESSPMVWPVRGNVLLDYSMDQTIYFPTLDQYKCNPGIVIQSDVSAPVAAPANARVTEVGVSDEIGNYVVRWIWEMSTQPSADS